MDVVARLADRLQHGRVGLLAVGEGRDGVAPEERMAWVQAVEHPVELHVGGVAGMRQQGVLEAAPVGQRLRLRLAGAPRLPEGLVGTLLLPALDGQAVDAEGEVDRGPQEGQRPGQIDPEQGRARLARLAEAVQRHQQGDGHMRQRAQSDRRPVDGLGRRNRDQQVNHPLPAPFPSAPRSRSVSGRRRSSVRGHRGRSPVPARGTRPSAPPRAARRPRPRRPRAPPEARVRASRSAG